MNARPKRPLKNGRQPLYAKIAVARRQLQIPEEAYRDLLRSRFGVSSGKDLSVQQLVEVVEHYRSLGFQDSPRKPSSRSGSRPLATSPEARKARALWLSLFNLGIVSDRSEKALSAYVKRQTRSEVPGGIDALQFVRDWVPVIEGLKDWAEREADVDWSRIHIGPRNTVENPRLRVVQAQCRILQIDVIAAYRSVHGAVPETPLFFCEGDLDPVIIELGHEIRARQDAANNQPN